jgi:hypothetical protein
MSYIARLVAQPGIAVPALALASGGDAAAPETPPQPVLDGEATARSFSGPEERARTAVRKAITRALDEVSATDPEAGGLLRASIRTGYTCCYAPSGTPSVSWSTSAAAGPRATERRR